MGASLDERNSSPDMSPMTSRPLTPGEIALTRSVFGDAIDTAPVRIHNRKWAFFQPRNITMAPMGHIHFHPQGGRYREDFSTAGLDLQGLFIHEMVHVWQHQQGIFLPLKRHPFCRYDYAIKPGQPLAARTEISDALSKDLLKRGFKFVGSTICYSFMQAVGMVNDHDSKCFRYRQIK